jgi:hypothetical protein
MQRELISEWRKPVNRFLSNICAAGIAASFAVGTVVPVSAAPVFVPNVPATASDIQEVRHGGPHQWKGTQRGRVVKSGDHAYYNKHRGYNHRRSGYRYHDGFWFPPAAFIAGAIIGGAVASQPRTAVVQVGSAHVQWCYNRWKSYREYDNSYQPYHGPRQVCQSPYWPQY